MTTLFSRIISGEIPGTFVHRDDVAVAFMTINPITDGHVLVVPREEVDQWTDLDPVVARHLFDLAACVGNAQKRAFGCERIGLVIAGYEVPHCHLHVIPTNSLADLSFANAAVSVERTLLEANAARIIAAL